MTDAMAPLVVPSRSLTPSLTTAGRRGDSEGVNRALAIVTGGALLVLLLGLGDAPQPVAGVVLAVLYAAVATWGFAYVERHPRRGLVGGYVAGQLVLGYAVFGLAGPTTGSTLLLLVLVVQAVVLLPLPWALLVAALVPLVHAGMSWTDGVREGTGLLVASLFSVALTLLHVREQRARQALAAANEQLTRYAGQVEELATTQERNRLARDIHDGLGHHLTVVQMQLQAARAVLPADVERADALLGKAQQQASEALAEVRRSVGALRETRAPAALDDALGALAAEASGAGVPTTLDVRGSARELLPATAESLYRTAQEGLTNVRKHAGASRASLLLDWTAPGTVRIEVRDDGRGAPALVPASAGGFGLRGLTERVGALGGTLTVEPSAGRGLTLRVELPG